MLTRPTAMQSKAIGLLAALIMISGCQTESSSTTAGPPATLPRVLHVACRSDGSTELRDVAARTSPDGVHIQVTNETGEPVSLSGTGLDFPSGTTELVSSRKPGTWSIACWPHSEHSEPAPDRTVVEIRDPDSFWQTAELECPSKDMVAGGTLDYVSSPSGNSGDPLRVVPTLLQGIANTDEIVSVGYPQSNYPSVAVVRDDQVVARASLSPSEGGGWYLASYSICKSAGISL